MRKLGEIVIPATSSKNNTNTAVPFAIAATIRRLVLRTADADLYFETKPDPVTPSTFVTTAAAGFPLLGDVALDETIPRWGAPTILAVYNAGAGPETLEVWTD